MFILIVVRKPSHGTLTSPEKCGQVSNLAMLFASFQRPSATELSGFVGMFCLVDFTWAV